MQGKAHHRQAQKASAGSGKAFCSLQAQQCSNVLATADGEASARLYRDTFSALLT